MMKYIVASSAPGTPWRIIGVANTGKQLQNMAAPILLDSRPPWTLKSYYENGIPVCINVQTGRKVRMIPVKS